MTTKPRFLYKHYRQRYYVHTFAAGKENVPAYDHFASPDIRSLVNRSVRWGTEADARCVLILCCMTRKREKPSKRLIISVSLTFSAPDHRQMVINGTTRVPSGVFHQNLGKKWTTILRLSVFRRSVFLKADISTWLKLFYVTTALPLPDRQLSSFLPSIIQNILSSITVEKSSEEFWICHACLRQGKQNDPSPRRG